MTLGKWLWLAPVALVVLAGCESNDIYWHGRFEVKPGVAGKQPVGGAIYVHDDQVFFNSDSNMSMLGVIADMNRSQATSLLYPLQATIQMKFSEVGDRFLFRCPPTDIDGCFKRMKYKATTQEGVDGHLCQVYENVVLAYGQMAHEKVWRPLDLKGVYMLRTEQKLADGSVTIGRIWDIKQEKFDTSMLKVPANYKPFNSNMLPAGLGMPAGH